MKFDIESIPARPGQIAVLTGANTGLGYETALELAKKSMKVVLACRNEQRANEAAERIRSEVDNADLDVMLVDVSSLQSVRDFAQRFRQQYNSLNLLINNAGIMQAPPGKTEDGFERVLAANYLGHFVLTRELLDLMPDTADSRVVSLASNAHKWGSIHLDDIHLEKKYSSAQAYAQSKLACLMFSDELQRRLSASGRHILATAAHPGGSLTELNRDMGTLGKLFTKLITPLVTHPVKAGAMPTLVAALSSDLQGGEYIGPTRAFEFKGVPGYAKRSKEAQDEAVGKRLFDLSEALTGCSYDL